MYERESRKNKMTNKEWRTEQIIYIQKERVALTSYKITNNVIN